MASLNMFNDLPSIEYALDEWHHAQSDRLQAGWPNHAPSYSIQTMNCFGTGSPLQSSNLYTQAAISRLSSLEINQRSDYEVLPWQPHSRNTWNPLRTRYEGVGPWAMAPEYASPSVACTDDRLTNDPDSCSDDSTWSPRSSEDHMEFEARNVRSPTAYHTVYYGGHAQSMQHTFYGRPPTISEASHSNSQSSGSCIKLQDVQQYPDAYQEDSFGKLPCEDVKVLYYPPANHPGSPAVQVEDTYRERCSQTATPIPREDIKAELLGSEQLPIKDESMSDVENDSGSDYAPMSRNDVNGGRTARKGRSSKLSPKRNSKVKAATKSTTKPNSIVKRHVKKPSSDTIIVSTHNVKLHAFICPHCAESTPSKAALSKHISTVHTRPFTCTFKLYGCPATFGSKNEWKRHVSTQHLRLGIWRCDLATCLPNQREDVVSEVIYNDFNRKDLFTQHIRRMHAPQASCSTLEREAFNTSLERAAKRCLMDIRSPPPCSVCGFCNSEQETVFQGIGSWEARMEHVGRHLESGHGEKQQWREDVQLREWMLQEGLIEKAADGQWRLVGLQVEDGKSKRAKK